MADLLVETDPVLETMVNTVVGKYSPRRIVLFGSRARADARDDSDYDMMVELDSGIFGQGIHRDMEDCVRAVVDVDFNLAIRTSASFQSRRDDPGFLDWDISREGVILYEREHYGPLASGVTIVSEPPDGWKSVPLWLHYAEDDWASVDLVLSSGRPLWTTITFHSQQCVEKLLKAYWVHRGQRPKKTHSLADLCTILSPAVRRNAVVGDAVLLLDSLYERSRYPGDETFDMPTRPPTEAEARLAAEGARTLREFVLPLFGSRTG